MRKKLVVILNILIIALAIIGTEMMVFYRPKGAMLTTSGIQNLKYFTVLSNEFCAIVACLWMVLFVKDKVGSPDKPGASESPRRWMVILKLLGAATTGLTFLVVAAFLLPIYRRLTLYMGSNLIFHLILPLAAMFEFAVMDIGKEKMPFKYTFFAVIPVLVYGTVYLVNILINGIGEAPQFNDWYGFLNWGYPVGVCIYIGIALAAWGIACFLRWVNYKLLIKEK